MSSSLPSWMARATELTRAGRLGEATALIQSALQQAQPASAPAGAPGTAGDVIDVAARVVDAPTDLPGPAAAPPPPTRPAEDDPRPATSGEGQWLSGQHTGSAGTRAYRLYVPPDASARVLPLVVMLHGCTQGPEDFARGTRMNDLARSEGFLVLYPEQARKANTSGCWNWFKHNHQRRGQGEPALLAGMVQAVMAQHGVDPQRVYVAGLSAGGAMAAILAHAYPELFAAVGVHSGLPVGAARDLPSALAAMQGGGAGAAPALQAGPPTIVFHGDQDSTVHPANGAAVVRACAGAASAASERAGTAGGRAYVRHLHADPSGSVRAEHWVVHGAGHAWSGGSLEGSYADARGPDASREMLRFFLEHPGPAPGVAG